jgi:hypothetical protein
VSLFATEQVLQPYAVSCAVSNDVVSRTLSVRLSQTEVGYPRLLWREAYQACVRDEESGWGGDGQLWASVQGAGGRVAYAIPGELQTLNFRFQPGVATYAQLVGKPGVYAIVTLDRGLRRFLNVRFLNRP